MKQTNGKAFISGFNQITENRKRNEARKLYQQTLSESLSSSAPALSYEYKGMWNFPAIDGNLTYHTAWSGEDCSYLVDAIRDVLLRFNLPCEVVRRLYQHSSTVVTARYLGVTDEKIEQALNSVVDIVYRSK